MLSSLPLMLDSSALTFSVILLAGVQNPVSGVGKLSQVGILTVTILTSVTSS